MNHSSQLGNKILLVFLNSMLKNFCSNYGNESCFTSKCKNGMCKSIFFFLSFFNFRIVQLAMAALELGRDNKSVFEQENELSFFVLVRPLWVHNGGVTAWPNQSRDRPWLLALLENNKEKKSSYFFRCEKEGGHLFKELCQEALQIDYPYKFLRTNLLTLENSSTLGWNWVSNLEEQPYTHAPPFLRDLCTKIPFYNTTDIEGIDYLLVQIRQNDIWKFFRIEIKSEVAFLFQYNNHFSNT